ncbi:hypothetical protein [Klebsiella phage vB_KpnM_TU02]|nr:hypothetical protein [Klebsiella phage vB_KpnM_TU02]
MFTSQLMSDTIALSTDNIIPFNSRGKYELVKLAASSRSYE